jgi:hypothetical protein
MRAVYPAETPLGCWRSRSRPRRVIRRRAHNAPASPWLSGGFGYGLYEGSSVLQYGVTNTEIHRNVGTAQFGGGIDVRTRLKLLFPIGLSGEVRDYYTLKTPRFGVPIQRREQRNVVVSAGLVVHF